MQKQLVHLANGIRDKPGQYYASGSVGSQHCISHSRKSEIIVEKPSIKMFSSTGLFKDVPCPKLGQCQLINCIFSHHQTRRTDIDAAVLDAMGARNTKGDEQNGDANNQEPQRKRRRLSAEVSPSIDETSLPYDPERVIGETPARLIRDEKTTTRKAPPFRKTAPEKDVQAAIESHTRLVSPPPLRAGKNSASQQTKLSKDDRAGPSNLVSVGKKKEALIPRPLTHAPAPYSTRMAILKQLHGAMTALNDKAEKDNETAKSFIMTLDELVTMALDEEERTARTKSTIYTDVLKQFIMQLKKMDLASWRKHVAEAFKSRFIPVETLPHKKPAEKVISTGLTPEQEVMVLQHMRTPLEGLERYGYVTSPPSAKDIQAAKDGVEAAGNFESCERCGSRFQVFPGRREEDGALTSGGTCTYHWAKAFRPQRQKVDHITGQRESYFLCCNEGMGDSAGCTKSPHHVFKISEAKRLASILQFERTPELSFAPDTGQKPTAAAFDAEMGYTTFGLELIRLTAVSWPSNAPLLDVLVRPLGEILDLNTRFSGITLSQMANAIPYSDLTPKPSASSTKTSTTISVSEDGELPPDAPPPQHSPALRIVPNPQAARSLLFALLTPSTPLIGHAIDNDLNTTRIIHPFIVDTVLLYPHPRGLPARLGLKALASKYLDREIQKAGARRAVVNGEGEEEVKGHDSKEDAVATGDLVRVKVGEEWKKMKGKGWKFE